MITLCTWRRRIVIHKKIIALLQLHWRGKKKVQYHLMFRKLLPSVSSLSSLPLYRMGAALVFILLLALHLMQSNPNPDIHHNRRLAEENGYIWVQDHVAFNYPISCNPASSQSEAPISQECRTSHKRIFEHKASSYLHKPAEYYSPINILQRSVEKMKNVTCDTTNFINMNRTFIKIRDPRSVVNIFVLGGSMTAGRIVGGYDGAWPRMLNSRLNEKLRPHSEAGDRFIVHNKAIPATSSHWALSRLPSLLPTDEDIDLVIIDYDINDCALINDSDEARGTYLSTLEVLIKRILAHKSNPAVVFLNVAINHAGNPLIGTCPMFPTCYSMHEIRSQLLSLYGVPDISQRDAIWEYYECYPYEHLWPCSKFCSHPWDNAHNLLADLIFGFLIGKSLDRSLELDASSLRNFTDREIYKTDDSFFTNEVMMTRTHPYYSRCDYKRYSLGESLRPGAPSQAYFHKKSEILDTMTCQGHLMNIEMETKSSLGHIIYKGDSNGNSNNSSSSGNVDSEASLCWKYMEDVAGKPGWISQGCESESIYFKLTFGHSPRLNVVYLSSYTPEYGKAEFFLSSDVGALGSTVGVEPSPFDTRLVYNSIGSINSMRGHDFGEWRKHSLSTAHLFFPKSGGNSRNQVSTSSVPDGLMAFNRTVFLKVSPSNPVHLPANPATGAVDPSQNNKNDFVELSKIIEIAKLKPESPTVSPTAAPTKPMPYKFKIMSVSTC